MVEVLTGFLKRSMIKCEERDEFAKELFDF